MAVNLSQTSGNTVIKSFSRLFMKQCHLQARRLEYFTSMKYLTSTTERVQRRGPSYISCEWITSPVEPVVKPGCLECRGGGLFWCTSGAKPRHLVVKQYGIQPLQRQFIAPVVLRPGKKRFGWAIYDLGCLAGLVNRQSLR